MDGDFNSAARAIMCALGSNAEGKLTPLQIIEKTGLSQPAFAAGKAELLAQSYVRSEGALCVRTDEGTAAHFGPLASPAP